MNTTENEAKGFQEEIDHAIAKGSNKALTRRYANMAMKWAAKLGSKKNQVLKTKGMATHTREDAFDKPNNKFDECLTSAGELLKEWDGEDNTGLLYKLLSL